MDIVYTNSDNKIVIEINHKYKIGDVVLFNDMQDSQFGKETKAVKAIGVIKNIIIGSLSKNKIQEALDKTCYAVVDYNNQSNPNFHSLRDVDIIKKIEL